MDSIKTAKNSSPLRTGSSDKPKSVNKRKLSNLKVIKEVKEPIDPIYDGLYMTILKREPQTPRSFNLCTSNDTDVNSLRDKESSGKILSSKNSLVKSNQLSTIMDFNSLAVTRVSTFENEKVVA